MSAAVVGYWYPHMPPPLPGEDAGAYVDRLTGANSSRRCPYDHPRNRQCSIGYHEECSERRTFGAFGLGGGNCQCPCHQEQYFAADRAEAWNETHPPGVLVTFGTRAPDEPDVVTISAAYVCNGYPVVQLKGFRRPVKLSWIEATQ